MDATFRAELRELNEQSCLRFEANLKQQIADFRTELRTDIASVRRELSELKAELIKWMFLFWLGTVATMLGFGRFLVTG